MYYTAYIVVVYYTSSLFTHSHTLTYITTTADPSGGAGADPHQQPKQTQGWPLHLPGHHRLDLHLPGNPLSVLLLLLRRCAEPRFLYILTDTHCAADGAAIHGLQGQMEEGQGLQHEEG